MLSRTLSIALISLAAFVSASPAEAKLTRKLERKVADVVRSVDEFMAMRDSEIPADLIDGATCIAVLPDVTKGAVGIGGRYGKGLVSCRTASGWSAPAFIELSGTSIGLQLGGEVMDLLLVVRNKEGADYLLRDRFTLGADASAAAGPVGRTVGAATDIAMKAGILTYSRTRGAFLGASLDGAVLKQDKTDNKKLYGRSIEARELLIPAAGEAIDTPASVKAFTDALQRHAPAQSK